jgi:hypothetical protein
MARIRTIKPEFFTSEQVADCSPTARLLFVGLWCFCDDGGVHPASAKRLKMELFPGDDMTEEAVLSLVSELTDVGLLSEYSAQGKKWWAVTGWHHQKIEKPNFRYPPPPFADHSPTIRLPVDDSSPPEGNGRESNGIPPNPLEGEREPKTKNKKDSPLARIESTVFPLGLDTPEVREAVGQWIEHRRERRPPATARSISMTFKIWDKIGPEPFVEAIQRSIANGYQGIIQPQRNGARAGPPATSPSEWSRIDEERAIDLARQRGEIT